MDAFITYKPRRRRLIVESEEENWSVADWRKNMSVSRHEKIKVGVTPNQLRKLARIMERDYDDSIVGDKIRKYTIGAIETKMNNITEIQVYADQTKLDLEADNDD